MRSKRQVAFEENMGDTTYFAAGKQNILIVSAGKGALTNYALQYLDIALEPKQHILLEDAGHSFTEGEVMQELFSPTTAWLNQQLKTKIS